MGVKLRQVVNPLEASIENGSLLIYFFDRIIKEVPLGLPHGITLERQCNFVETNMNRVTAYLRNDKYTIIIRSDGTIDTLTNDFILLRRDKIDIDKIYDDKMSVYLCGSLFNKSSFIPLYLSTLSSGESFIFSKKAPIVILLDTTDPVNERIKLWAEDYDDVGTLRITDNTTGYSALWVNFGRSENIQMDKFKVLTSNGFIGGV